MPPPSRLRGAGEHGGGGARRVGVLAARLQATSRCRRARATVMLLCRGRLRLTGWQASPRFTHALAVHAGPNQLKEVTSGAGSGRSRRTHPPAAKKNRRCATRRAVDIRCTTHHSITYHHHHHQHCNHHCASAPPAAARRTRRLRPLRPRWCRPRLLRSASSLTPLSEHEALCVLPGTDRHLATC